MVFLLRWYDCKEFLDALNRKEGTTAYRLPTLRRSDFVSLK